MKHKMKYQNYIFDLYGTLADIHTDEADAAAWEKLALFYGYYRAGYTPEELEADYRRFVQEAKCERGCENSIEDSHEGNPEIQIERVFERLFLHKGVQPEQTLVYHTGQFFRVLTTDYLRLYEGVPKMLGSLKKMGRRIYLLSNAQRIFTENELQMLDIARYFDGILISSDYGVKKPDIRFFQQLLEQYQLDLEESIMIGNDFACDIEGAKKAGLDTYFVYSNLSPLSDRKIFADKEKITQADYVQKDMDIAVMCQTLGIFV